MTQIRILTLSGRCEKKTDFGAIVFPVDITRDPQRRLAGGVTHHQA
jgi:hypothetical protein